LVCRPRRGLEPPGFLEIEAKERDSTASDGAVRSVNGTLSLSLNLTSFSTLFSLFYFPQELSLLLQALGSRISWSRNHQNSELLRRWLQSGLEAALPSTEQQRRHRRLDPPRRLLLLP
jgi:hypothetical protein